MKFHKRSRHTQAEAQAARCPLLAAGALDEQAEDVVQQLRRDADDPPVAVNAPRPTLPARAAATPLRSSSE
jgi:hypothetical protein